MFCPPGSASSRPSVPVPRCPCSSVSSAPACRSASPLSLIAAPMVNEVALGLLFALVGWKVAVTYLAFGLGVAIVSGWVIGRLHLENWLEDWVRNLRTTPANLAPTTPTVIDQHRTKYGGRLRHRRQGLALDHRGHRSRRLHPRLCAVEPARRDNKGRDAWWSVPAAVLLGIPMYSNAAGIIPVVEALLTKGVALGTTCLPS